MLPPSKTASAKRHPRIRVRDRGLSDLTWALGSSLQLGYVVPTIIACRPHPPVWSPPSHFPAVPVIEPVFGTLLPGHQTFRAFPAVLSRIAAFSSAGGFGMCLPQFFHTNTGHHEKVGTTWPPRHSRKSASRGVPNFGDLSVRSRYGPPGCSLPGLIWTRKLPARLELLLPGFQPLGHPNDCRI